MATERPLPVFRQVERPLTDAAGAALRLRHDAGRERGGDQGRKPDHVVNADLFRGALIRERKAADRSNQEFGVLLINLADRQPVGMSVWDAAIEAASEAKRDTDVLGWFETGISLGIILSDIGGAEATMALDVEQRVTRELTRRLDPGVTSRFLIKLHVHRLAGQTDESSGAFVSVDPLIAEVRSPAPEPSYASWKRALDVGICLMLLAILSPVLLMVAALIKLTSRGPILFRQLRIGENAQPFEMLKFRSMRTNSSTNVHQDYVTWFIKSSDSVKAAEKSQVFKITDDPRVTSIGRFIRRTSIDELPQLWNVVRGDMSLVGPRPPLPYEVAQYKAWHTRRVLEAKPGITGLWQVAGRSRTTFDEMVRLDLRYARTCSLWTDLKILLATPRAVIGGKGAC